MIFSYLEKRSNNYYRRKTSIVVAVSEGIRTEDGTYVCELGNSIDFVDAFGHKQLSGTASYLASYIAGEIGCKTRAIELSTLQRAASHAASRVDILEAYQVGGAAVKAADEGDSGKMVVLKRLSDDPYQCGTEVKDVHKIANDEKLVPRSWVNKEGTYEELDMYGLGKTFQYILASVEAEPRFNRREEYRLQRIIFQKQWG